MSEAFDPTNTDYQSSAWYADMSEEARAAYDALRENTLKAITIGAQVVAEVIEGEVFPLATRDAILGVVDDVVEELAIPEWRMRVRIKGLSAKERDQYEQSLTVGKGQNQTLNMNNARAKLAMMTVVDGDGKPMFTRADIDALGKKSAVALERIFDRARKLSGLTDQDMDELTGN